MDESAPITWTINELTSLVSTGADTVATTIATTIAPLFSIGFGIYILLIMVNYMRGAETEPVLDFCLRCVAFAVVIGLGINAANYTSTVMPIVTGIGNDLANAVSGGTVSAGTLDQLTLHYLKIIDDSNSAIADFQGFTYLGAKINVSIKSLLVMLGLVPFLVAATMTIVVANVGSIFVAMVGPLYFGFLLFPATRQYFSAWVNTAFSYALIPLLVSVISMVSVGLSKKMIADASGKLNDISFKIVFLCVIGNLLLLCILRHVSALASSLSAGGINAAMPNGLGAAVSGVKSAGKSAGSAAKGGVATYKAGKAAYNYVQNKRNSIGKAG